MQYFNFARLINKYSAPFTLVTKASGGYVGGRYQEGTETTTELDGAILSQELSKTYQSGGTFSTQDRWLYMLQPIAQSIEGAKVRFNGQEYKVEQDRDKGIEHFTGVYCYLLKWVSVFDKS